MQTIGRKALVLVVLWLSISLTVSLSYKALGWDEAMYGCISRELVRNLWGFKICGIPVLHKPPLYPYIVAIICRTLGKYNELILRLVPVISGMLTLIVTQLIYMEVEKERGVLPLVILSLIPLHIYFSSRCLSDVLGSLTATLVILSAIQCRKRAVSYVALGISAALSIMARYTNLQIAAIAALYLILACRNIRGIIVAALSFIISILPLLLLNFKLYNHPYKGLYFASRLIQMDVPISNWLYVSWVLIYLNPLFVAFSLVGAYYLIKDKKAERLIIVLWWIIPIISNLFLVHKEERFLMVVCPATAILATIGIRRVVKSKITIFALILASLLISSYVFIDFYERNVFIGEAAMKAGLFLRKVSSEGEIISVSYTHLTLPTTERV